MKLIRLGDRGKNTVIWRTIRKNREKNREKNSWGEVTEWGGRKKQWQSWQPIYINSIKSNLFTHHWGNLKCLHDTFVLNNNSVLEDKSFVNDTLGVIKTSLTFKRLFWENTSYKTVLQSWSPWGQREAGISIILDVDVAPFPVGFCWQLFLSPPTAEQQNNKIYCVASCKTLAATARAYGTFLEIKFLFDREKILHDTQHFNVGVSDSKRWILYR